MKHSEMAGPSGWGAIDTDIPETEAKLTKEEAQKALEEAKVADVSAMAEKLEDEIVENESPEMIRQHVKDFTEFLVEKYPQMSKDGKVNYYLSGSLALTLLSETEKFETLDPVRAPEVSVTGEKEIPEDARKDLAAFIRQIGDLDYVPFEHWKQLPKEQRMAKGGGGPKVSELSESANKAFIPDKRRFAVMCDPLSASTEHRIARIKMNGKDVYITEPDMIMAYKAVHLSEAFENGRKTHKFVKDFAIMKKSMEKIYPAKELVKTTKDLIMAYSPKSPNGNYIPYHNPEFNDEFKKFFDDMIALDDDAKYLEKMEFGKERSIGILKILHQYPGSENKEAIIEFMNQEKDSIDKWEVNTTSAKNMGIMADYIMNDSVAFASLQSYSSGRLTKDRESIMEAVNTQPYVFEKYGRAAQNYGTFENKVASSDTLDLLLMLDKDHVKEDLENISELIKEGMTSWDIKNILESDYSKDRDTRKKLFAGVLEARKNLDKDRFGSFMNSLTIAAKDKYYYDETRKQFLPVNEAERPGKVVAAFAEFGVKYE